VVIQHEVWVAEDDELVIGFAAPSPDMLMWMYVHPDAENRGAGSALLDRAKLERPGGFRLWTFQRNTGARRFYERHGLLPVELTDGSGNEEKEPDALYEWAP
jgi:GNAT superfamily N-acetyltransferase